MVRGTTEPPAPTGGSVASGVHCGGEPTGYGRSVRTVSIHGGPAPFREALTTRLESNGWSVGDDDEDSDVVVRFCEHETAWANLEADLAGALLAGVAVLPRLDPEAYRRALRIGAGVVFHDTSTEIMVQVIESAAHGEALIPMEVARHLASADGAGPTTGVEALTALERSLLEALVGGDTVAELGERFHFSDRTIRRRLQSAYLKIGVEDRVGAIRRIERERLLG